MRANLTMGFSVSAVIESTSIVVQPSLFPQRTSVKGLSPTKAVVAADKLLLSINDFAAAISGFLASNTSGKSYTFFTFSIYAGL